MKRLFITILLFFIYSQIVIADEYNYVEDRLTIEELNVQVVLVSRNMYNFKEEYKTKLIFGNLPSTLHFVKNIPLKGNIYYNNEKIDYTSELDKYDVNSDIEFLIDESNENNNRFIFGSPYDLFKETEEININYDIVINDNKNLKLDKEFNYVIAQNEYDTEKTKFSIVLPFKRTKSDVSFSLNGKDFSSKLDGISYKISNEYIVEGTYSKTLKAGEKLSVKINLVDNSTLSISKKQLVVYISLGVGFTCLLGITTLIIKRNKKR